MTSYKFARDNDYEIFDTDQIDEVLALFNMHNLMPELSKNEHVYAASLAMLVRLLKWHGNSKHLFEALPFAKDRDIDLLDIMNTMANLGYSNHTMEINLTDVDKRLMPCLFISDDEKEDPLVLIDKNDDLITAFHSKDRKKVTFKAGMVSGEVIFFEKIDQDLIQEKAETAKAAGFSWFDNLFRKFRPIMREILVTSFLINLFSLVMPLFLMTIYDQVIDTKSTNTLFNLVIGVMVTMAAEGAFRIIRIKSLIWIGVRLDNIVNNTVVERLLMMQSSYTEGVSISAQMSRIRSFDSIRRFFTGPLFSVITELPFTLIMVVVIWSISGNLVYIPIAVSIIFCLMLFYYRHRLKLAMRFAARSSTKRQEIGTETFLKMHKLRQNGMTNIWFGRYKERLSDSCMLSFKTNMISNTIEAAAHGILVLSGLAVVAFGVQSIWDQQMTTGALVATMLLIWRVLGPLQTLCSMLPRIESLQSSIEQINRLMNIDIERKNSVIKKPITQMRGDIKIRNLGLRYSLDVDPIFVALDIEVNKGQVIAITGHNGSGKSSVLKLINGLYKSQTGTVHIDDINIKQLDPIELRSYINYLPQIPNLFEGSIKDNLLLVNPLATDDDIENALKKANIYDWINSLKDGLNTFVNGVDPEIPNALVYGINLARVYLKDSNIMLLDEMPNSILNGQVGDSYRSLLRDNKGEKTIFFVTQRSDFIEFADKVIMLESGNRPNIMTSKAFLEKYVA